MSSRVNLNLQFCRDMRIPFLKTNAGATAAGDNPVRVVGVTEHDFIFTSDFRGRSVPLNCRRAVVVDSLGSEVLFGEPAKQHNQLDTSSSKRTISVRYNGELLVKKYLSHRREDY